MGQILCERCHGTGTVNSAICPACNGTGRIRKIFSCPVCSGQYYVPRDPPVHVRCPFCNSILMTSWESIQVLERGTVPIPPPGSKAPLGAIGGGALGLAVAGPLGGLIGFLLGVAAGAAAEKPMEAEEA